MKLHCQTCSQLVKVFMDTFPAASPYTSAMALQGETFSYQIAIHIPGEYCAAISADLDETNDLNACIQLRQVVQMPVSLLACSNEFDDGFERRTPGLYPDLLTELRNGNQIIAPKYGVMSLWVTVKIPETCKPGIHNIIVKITAKNLWNDEETVWARPFALEVLSAKLPPQTLKCTMWFHSDCIATYYNIEQLSEKHWSYIGNFMKNAREHGITLLLTPIFSLALDTKVGHERPTCQLVGVKRTNGKYSFDFSLVERWMNLAESNGIRYYEISHLFTQWGAKATPKIVADVDGETKRIFGWDVASDSREYVEFLEAFLPEFASWLKARQLQDRVYFHCSDEPTEKQIDSYAKAAALLHRLLPGFKILDALSEVEFFQNGIVEYPVPVENKLEDFIKANMKEIWTYYCCGPHIGVCNRFTAMKSVRNRNLGTLLYYYNVEGFLQWGYNFYYAQLSEYPINPYMCLDAGGKFPAGDSFIVYPGPNGVPEDSIRGEVFYAGLQDMRALQLLETKMPREEIKKILDTFTPNGKMAMDSFPMEEADFLPMRARINELIKEHFA